MAVNPNPITPTPVNDDASDAISGSPLPSMSAIPIVPEGLGVLKNSVRPNVPSQFPAANSTRWCSGLTKVSPGRLLG